MSINIKDLPKVLPDSEHDFVLESDGAFTKAKYSGKFKFRVPNIKASLTEQKKFAELNGTSVEEELKKLPEDVLIINSMIAFLHATLVECPEWFKASEYGHDLYDSNILGEIYTKCKAFEREYTEKLWAPKDEQN